MTLDEKIGQLNLLIPGGATVTGPAQSEDVDRKIREGKVGGLFGVYDPVVLRRYQEMAIKESRLGIPLLLGLDVIHGHTTMFPIPLGLSCSWDMALIEASARVAAREATSTGLNWVFSPMVDICRDPRWGRIAEGSGEDPYLGACVAQAMVRGYQGDDFSAPGRVLACVKHFALYGAAEGGRDYNTTDMSRMRMLETYFPPFRAAVEAGVGCLMCAFNDVDGVPATANDWLLNQVLRKQWGFEGLVVSDYAAVSEMITHGLGDLKTVSARALRAGTDMDMASEGYLGTLREALEHREVDEELIDIACTRVLQAKWSLGLFEDPYRGGMAADPIPLDRSTARVAAAKSCVLLQNRHQVLPLSPTARVAIVGPLAHSRENMTGCWNGVGQWQDAVTLLEGLQAQIESPGDVLYAKGANISNNPVLAERAGYIDIDSRSPADLIAEAVMIAEKSDVVIAALGESKEMSGEATSRADIGIPPDQRPLLEALIATGKPVVLVVFTGRPLTLEWEAAQVDAMLVAWFGGTEAGNGIADVLTGRHTPSGKLSVSFPRHVGQIPVYYAHKRTGRPASGTEYEPFRSSYLDISTDPLFPFGHGLSYTRFEYGEVTIHPEHPSGEVEITVRVQVSNSGECAGEETVQLYLSDPAASVTRPVRELKGFQKIYLAPGEEKELKFMLTTQDLKFVNSDLEWVWEPGEFVLHVGGNSQASTSFGFRWER